MIGRGSGESQNYLMDPLSDGRSSKRPRDGTEPPQDNHLPVAFGNGSEQTLVNTARQEETSKDQSHLNRDTLLLVEALKGNIKDRLRSDPSIIKRELIEDAVANVRRERKYKQLNIDQWKKNLPSDINNCPEHILKLAMAYGDDPNDVKAVLEEKMNESQEETNTSLVKIIAPLKALKKELSGIRPPNLFQAVLNIKNNEFNRADRILFSEASYWMNNPSAYTVDIAHDQVEAIRLTHYNSQDPQQLYTFIKKNRTFDDAYTYLQNLAKEQARVSSAGSNRTQSTGQQQISGSILRQASNDGNDSNPTSPSSSKSRNDTQGNSSTLARPSSRSHETNV
ncbi:unnamed protein product [Rotaria magnacalcarata]|uniref:Uncharacterized protein n=1 Tax=Rotaria magnacalcarata TaxID=392030 RepID=A0A816P2V3_9BILA|nr:unnamed protein product [Rotaria magnacalcarata]